MVAEAFETVDPELFPAPLWRTENGGLVEHDNSQPGMYRFVVSPPSFPELNRGDLMRDDWRIQAANELARKLKVST